MPFETKPLRLRPYPSIAEHGLVGDGRSAALVTSEGAVAWWCPQRFDAPSVFASLLDARRGGHFAVSLPGPHRREWGYLPGTNVLQTTFVSAKGRARLLTAMPRGPPRPRLVQVLEGVEGEVEATVELAPGFDYARAGCLMTEADGAVVADADAGDERLVLTSTLDLRPDAHRLAQTFRVHRGERHAFVLEHGGSTLAPLGDPLGEADEGVERDVAYWREWLARCDYDGRDAERVHRSLLALKLLQHEETGAFVAAPTTSLPERPGGRENWDYRYAWLRDGSFIVMAFETFGYREEAARFRRWLARVVARDAPDRLQMLYRVDGGRDLDEMELDHLEGWRGARPVRVGNAAAEQNQLDTLGEVMMCFHRAEDAFRERGDAMWASLRSLVDRVCDTWDAPDSGIWETRGQHLHYAYSKAMAWLAITHGLRIARDRGFEAPVARWEDARRRLRAWLGREARGPDGAYVQAAGGDAADAAALLFPLFGYDDADDDAMVATVARARRDLVSHGLVHRHLQARVVGDEGAEGAFLACGFWLAHDLAHLGRLDEARAFFEASCAVASPVGLLPEEADPVTREGLGNHPQALSHLSLLMAAWALDAAQKGKLGTRTRVTA